MQTNKKYWYRYLWFVVRHPLLVIGITSIITLCFALAASTLKVKNTMEMWLPTDHPYVETTRKIHEIFGGHDIVVIGISPESGDIYQAGVLQKISRLQDKLQAMPEAVPNSVLSLAAKRIKAIHATSDGMEAHRPLEKIPQTADEIAVMRRGVQENPFFIGTLVSADSRFAAVIAEVKLDKAALGFTKLNEDITKIVDSERTPGIHLYASGTPVGFAAVEKYSATSGILFGIAFITIMMVQYFSFKSFQGMLLPMLTGLLSVLWGLGVLAIFHIDLDVLNTTTPILIMAITSGHAIQLLKRYYEEYYRLTEKSSINTPVERSREAVVESLARVGAVTAAAGIIASITFFSVGFAKISMLRHFGLFAGVGILSGLILELTLIPALRSLLRPPQSVKTNTDKRPSVLDKLLIYSSNQLLSGRAFIILVFGFVLISVVAVGIIHVRADSSTMQYLSGNHPVRLDDQAIRTALAGTTATYFLIETPLPDGIKDPAVLSAMQDLQKFLDHQPGVGKTQSLADLVKRMNQAMHNDDPTFFEVPKDRNLIAQYLLLYAMSGDPNDFDNYVDSDYRRAIVLAYMKSDSTSNAESLYEKVRPFIAKFPKGVTVQVGGPLAESVAINRVVVREKIFNTLQMAVAIFVLTAIMLRSVVGGLFVVIPVLFIITANFGAMGWLGIPLDMGTATSASMAIGIGADYELYLLYRFREEIQRGGSIKHAMEQSLMTSGKAVIFVALAIICGYSVLYTSDFIFYSRLATSVVITMIISAFSSIIFLRALILTFKPKFIFGKIQNSATQSIQPLATKC